MTAKPAAVGRGGEGQGGPDSASSNAAAAGNGDGAGQTPASRTYVHCRRGVVLRLVLSVVLGVQRLRLLHRCQTVGKRVFLRHKLVDPCFGHLSEKYLLGDQ